MVSAILNEADRGRIRQAVAAAEAKTAGEIFTVVAEESDDYRFIPILWATLIALIVPLPLIFLTLWPASLIFLIQLAAFVVLALVFSHPAVRPAVVPPGVKHGAARALAVRQFLAHGLHTTEARTGVLIFVSLVERHAEIIADAGISAKVDDAVWQAAADWGHRKRRRRARPPFPTASRRPQRTAKRSRAPLEREGGDFAVVQKPGLTCREPFPPNRRDDETRPADPRQQSARSRCRNQNDARRGHRTA